MQRFLKLSFLLFLFSIHAIYKTHTQTHTLYYYSVLSNLRRQMSFCFTLQTVAVWCYHPLQSSSGQLGDVDETSAWTCLFLLFHSGSFVRSAANSEWGLGCKASEHAPRASASQLQSRLKRAAMQASNSRVTVFPPAERNSFQCDFICAACMHIYEGLFSSDWHNKSIFLLQHCKCTGWFSRR